MSVTTANVARTGAKMADLDRQLKLIGTGVQYVTVLLGANDVCTSSPATMTDPALFRKQFEDAMGAFFGTHPDSYVFVSSIPNVRQLYELLTAFLVTIEQTADEWPSRVDGAEIGLPVQERTSVLVLFSIEQIAG